MPTTASEALMREDEVMLCVKCRHDVDDHDERARCLTPPCPCGWQ